MLTVRSTIGLPSAMNSSTSWLTWAWKPIIAWAPMCAELVHARQPADEERPVADVHVARQRDAVGEHGAVAQAHVMGDVHVGHDPVVRKKHALFLVGAGVERAELADRVAVADAFGDLALVVIGRRASGSRS